MFNPNNSPFSQGPYGSEVLPYGDPRRSLNPFRAIAAHVRWEIVAGFLIVIGFFGFVLAQDQENLIVPGTIGLVTAGWIFSLCLHEFAHAATAYLGGDHSDSTRSYLTFNPLKYLHPVLSIILPLVFMLLGGIGLPGGAVYLRRDLVRNRAWQSTISLAGPLMNALCLGIIALAFRLPFVQQHPFLASALALLALLEAFAIVFNLLPIPPLDGFGVLSPFLPRDVVQAAYAFGSYSILLIFILMSTSFAVNQFVFGTLDNILAQFGISPLLARIGFFNFQFWQHG